MKREIIFRGKAKYNGQGLFSGDWIEGDLFTNLDPHTVEREIVEAFIRPPIGNIAVPTEVNVRAVGQFIGLTNYKEKRIFEDDILRSSDGQEWVVIFSQGSFKARHRKEKWRYIYGMQLKKLEIIGTIHD